MHTVWVRVPLALPYERVAKLVRHLTFNQEISRVRSSPRSPLFFKKEVMQMPLMGKYEYIIDKTHPRANEDGQVYLHIIVAEQKVGRYLLPEEVVHHKDLNKLNNEPNNLMIFATKGDHTRFHMCGCDESILELNTNGSYFCNSHQNQCVDCGIKITKDAIRCPACACKNSRKVNRPTLNELHKLIIDLRGNFTQIGKIYGVTDNTIRKWCDAYGLSRYSRDYK